MRELVHARPTEVLWQTGSDDDRWFVRAVRVPGEADEFHVATWAARLGPWPVTECFLLTVVVEGGRPRVAVLFRPPTPAAQRSEEGCVALAKDVVMEVIENKWL